MNWSLSRHFVLSINFHGGAVVANYPWDGMSTPCFPARRNTSKVKARAFTALILSHGFTFQMMLNAKSQLILTDNEVHRSGLETKTDEDSLFQFIASVYANSNQPMRNVICFCLFVVVIFVIFVLVVVVVVVVFVVVAAVAVVAAA